MSGEMEAADASLELEWNAQSSEEREFDYGMGDEPDWNCLPAEKRAQIRDMREERKFGRLRELCRQSAWTVESAAWTICGFDRSGFQKGDHAHGETDAWMPFPGVKRDQHEPEPEGLAEDELRALRWERFQERRDTDEARHALIHMTALRLAGLLLGGAISAHPPRRILEVASEIGMSPPWLNYARKDPELAGLLANEPVVSFSATMPDIAGPLQDTTRAVPSSEQVAADKAAKDWPSLYSRLEPGWQKGAKSSFVRNSGNYPYWSHMIAYDYTLRHRYNQNQICANLILMTPLALDIVTSFTPYTVKGWRKYKTREDVALRVLQWRLLGLERPRPHGELPDLDQFLNDAEQDFARPAKSL